MPLEPGTALGPYSVTAKIGEGGMGEVYRARDTKLDRDVALKVLPQAFTDDPDRLARFEREAKVLASLNHPNIGHIYGLEEADGQKALVLELVEGPTLADRIKQGPIPVDEALPIAKQIAEALEAAHEQGVIHRDLKPANVKVKDDGTVKVLDFGLAKAFQPDTSDVSASMSPTISLTAAATQMGMVIGTAAYMAPEQASGKVVDKRADVWAFGVVLYEMLTGTRPFVGDDVSKTLAHVIAIDPDWGTLPDNLPPVLGSFLRGCLEKNPKKRVGDIRDVRLAMEGVFEPTAPPIGAAAAHLQVWQRPFPMLLAVLVLLGASATVGWHARPTSPGPVVRFEIVPPSTEPMLITFSHTDVTITPDGRRIIYTASLDGARHLYIRSLGELEAVALAGTEAGVSPVASPDGQWVAFYDQTQLKKVSIGGGTAVALAGIEGDLRGASWGADDRIVFGQTETGLMRVSASGGEPEVLTTPDGDAGEVGHWLPSVLPNLAGVLFTIGRGETSDVAVLDLASGQYRVLVTGASSPRYAPPGYLLYTSGGPLYAAGFDPERLELTSAPVPVVDEVVTKGNGTANFNISPEGTLLYVVGDSFQATRRTLVWIDREGEEVPLSTDPDYYSQPRISPDGGRVAVKRAEGDPTSADIWVFDLERQTRSRLTFDGQVSGGIAWSPDSERIAFGGFYSSSRGGLFWKNADGSGAVEAFELAGGLPSPDLSLTFVPDGSGLVVDQTSRSGDLILVNLEDSGGLTPLVETGVQEGRIHSERNPDVSPNGRWLAYDSSQSGQAEIYVQPFPNVADGLWQISTGGGLAPVWSKDGSELLYQALAQDTTTRFGIPRDMMAVPVNTEAQTFSYGAPKRLLSLRALSALGIRMYDISPDGQRILMARSLPVGETALPQINVVLNWHEELLQRVPMN